MQKILFLDWKFSMLQKKKKLEREYYVSAPNSWEKNEVSARMYLFVVSRKPNDLNDDRTLL